jgi:hypothetical protein
MWAPEPVRTLWKRDKSYPCRELNPDRLNPWPVAIPTELSRPPDRFTDVTLIYGGNEHVGSGSNTPDLFQGRLVRISVGTSNIVTEIRAFPEPVHTNTWILHLNRPRRFRFLSSSQNVTALIQNSRLNRHFSWYIVVKRPAIRQYCLVLVMILKVFQL